MNNVDTLRDRLVECAGKENADEDALASLAKDYLGQARVSAL